MELRAEHTMWASRWLAAINRWVGA